MPAWKRYAAIVTLSVGVHLAAYSQGGSLIAAVAAGVLIALFVILVTE